MRRKAAHALGGSSKGHARSQQGAKLNFSYSSTEDVLTIEGIRYAGSLFRRLAQPDDGQIYRLVCEHGVVVLSGATWNQAFDDEAGLKEG
jgi:hypothetical protein